MKVRFHRLAVEEIDHEVDYYESRQPGLGSELEDEIDAVLDLIRRFPKAAPQWKGRADRRKVRALMSRMESRPHPVLPQ
jgi:plasmid stabilization system protein ParE